MMNLRIVNDLINQSQNGKYGDTSGIGQLIHQVCILFISKIYILIGLFFSDEQFARKSRRICRLL